MGTLSLLQGIFPTQGSNPGLPNCRWILYQLGHEGNPYQNHIKQLLSIHNPSRECFIWLFPPIFWSRQVASGILVPQSRIQRVPPAVEALSHGNAREALILSIFKMSAAACFLLHSLRRYFYQCGILHGKIFPVSIILPFWQSILLSHSECIVIGESEILQFSLTMFMRD